MAEKMPQGAENKQEGGQEQAQALVKELGPLLQKLQSEQSPEGKAALLRRIMDILAQLKQMLPPEVYAQQFGKLEMQLQQAAGGLEG
jgi:hypothetical protein